MSTIVTFRSRRHQTNVASPARQKQWRLTAQHDSPPQPDTRIKAPSAQQAAAITTIDSHSPARRCTYPQQASLSLPLEQEQHQQQQTTHQGPPISTRARHQGASPMLLQPQKVTSPEHLRKLRKQADPSESGGPASGQQVSARAISVHAFDAMGDDFTIKLVHQQAEAVRLSAQAVLRSLDWADSQLTCSPPHAAVSPSAGMHSSGSNGQSKAGQVGTAAGETGCEQARGEHPLHTHTASCRQGPHVDLVSGLGTLHGQLQLKPDAALGPRLTAAAAGALHGLSQQQSATSEDGSRRVTSCAAMKEDGRGGSGRENSGVADSEATWSEGGDLHSSSPSLAPPEQV